MDMSFQIARLADIETIEKVPFKERIKENSTYEIIRKGAQINPQSPAISFLPNGDNFGQPMVISYQQLLGRINQTANMLFNLGIGPEDVVTFLLPNLPQTHFVLWGAEAVGIANPINPLLEAETIRDICIAAKSKVIVALGEFPDTDIWEKVEAIRKEIPTLKAVIRVMGSSNEKEKIYSYDEKIEQYPGDSLTFNRQIQPDDIASLYHTGGTTGRPKLARRAHYNEVVLAYDIAIATELKPGETVMCGLPLFHCNGTCVTGLMPFSVGGHVVLLSPQGYRNESIMKNFWKIVDHFQPVFFSAVPTVLGVLLDVPLAGARIDSLRFAICGAAPLSVELFKRFESYSGLKVLEGYGLTETACASAVNPKDGERKIGSIGIRLPYHWIKVVVVDKDGKYVRDAETNEIGTICVKGPCVFKGYVEEIHNRNIWMDEKKEWFNTGDLGRQDKDGYLWLTGRTKELIIRGGHNIDPATIEEPIYQLDGIKLVAAIGQPDSHAGEVPVAYVQLNKNSQLSEENVMEWAKQHIGERAAIPKRIKIVDEIPLTAVGKVFKPELRFDAIQQVYENQLKPLANEVESLEVKVSEDKIHGTLSTIYIHMKADSNPTTVEKEINNLLSKFTVRYRIEMIKK